MVAGIVVGCGVGVGFVVVGIVVILVVVGGSVVGGRVDVLIGVLQNFSQI